MDMIEEAEASTELFFQQALRRRGTSLQFTGQCHFCEETTTGAFCSLECREDYEKMERVKRITGRV
jgi:hypothetical protein